MLIKRAQNSNHKIIVTQECCETFATFTNHVIQTYATNSEWFLLTHDDVILQTKRFLPKVERYLENLNSNIGWISFTDTDYVNGHWAPSTRPGYHDDFVNGNAWDERTLFQFHKLQPLWTRKNKSYTQLNYDFPKQPVICHTPFSHFILIETKKLFEIGLCEDWSPVSLLIDEDWGLRALQKYMINIWMPNVRYQHHRASGITRASSMISLLGKSVNKQFEDKWGFSPSMDRKQTVEIVQGIYGGTNILWSVGRKSYEWEYVI